MQKGRERWGIGYVLVKCAGDIVEFNIHRLTIEEALNSSIAEKMLAIEPSYVSLAKTKPKFKQQCSPQTEPAARNRITYVAISSSS